MAIKFKHLEKIVGIFLTIVLLVIIVTIMIIGSRQRWFEKHYEFNAKFLRGEGLSAGMQVTIKGIQIGEAKSVFLNEDNWIEVTFSVYEEYAERIRQDSIIKLNAPIIGSKTLEIIPGEKTMPVLESGSYIWSQDTRQGMRILETRAKEEEPDEITRILRNAEQLTYNLSAQEGNLNQTLEKIQTFFTMLSSQNGSLNKTLASLRDITQSINNREGSIGKFIEDDYELYNTVISITKKLDLIMDDFKTLSETIADTTPEVKAAIERSNTTMDEAIGLIKTLKQNFFVKGFSSRKEDKIIPIENAEREGGY